MSINTIDFHTICRGSGKIFLDFSFQGNEPSLDISSLANGFDSAVAIIKKKDSTDPNAFVMVLPQLEIDQTITFSRPGQAPVTKTIRPAKAKIASKYAYARNNAAAQKIRDFDKKHDVQSPKFEIWEMIPDGEYDILRGQVLVPDASANVTEVACFSEQNEKISEKCTIFQSRVSPIIEGSNSKQLAVQFSLHVKRDAKCHVFRAYDEGSVLPGFESFDHHQYDLFVKESSLFTLNAQVDPAYHEWFLEHRPTPIALEAQKAFNFKAPPLFSIIVPLFKTPLHFFNDMLDSVTSQTYKNWQLILVNASPEDSELCAAATRAEQSDERIKLITLNENLGITENTNAGIEAAEGDYICFFDHDDLLEPNLLFEYAKAIEGNPAIGMLYCDEDKLLTDGHFVQPFFKPDFSIDLLRNNNYICHLLTVKKEILDKLDRPTSKYDGAQDHNLALKVSEVTKEIHHVPHVLYHWRMSETSTAANAGTKSYATEAGITAVQEHLDRLGVSATVEQSRRPFTYKINYDLDGEPLVSIIIPSKDGIDILDRCLQSIKNLTTYRNYEVIVIENNSTDPSTFEYYKSALTKFPNLRVEYWEESGFNYSKLNNFGAAKANGEYFVLLNNDTEVITPNWIERMLGICQREEVGAVGVRLRYEDRTIQHAGLCVTGGVAGHLNRCLPEGQHGYFALADAEQNLSAVTAACMMVSKADFFSVSGFTEELAVAFNDVDFCLKLRAQEKLIVYTPEVELLHYESISRGLEDTPQKKIRFHKEFAYMNYAWAEYYALGDPYINPNFDTSEPLNRYYRLPHFD